MSSIEIGSCRFGTRLTARARTWMAKTKSSKQFIGASPVSLNYTAGRVYGISGAVGVANSDTTVAEWTTGGEVLDAKLQLMYIQVDSNDDMEWQIYMNGILISGAKNSDPQTGSEYDNPLLLILAPYTTLKITAKNASSSSTRSMGAILTATILKQWYMSLAASKSVSRAKGGNIYGWSGSQALSASGVTLLSYTNPSAFYLTRVTLGVDWSSISAGEVLSYTINVDGTALFVEKFVVLINNIGIQPKMFEFMIPPNSTVKVQAAQDANNGAISCLLTGYRV